MRHEGRLGLSGVKSGGGCSLTLLFLGLLLLSACSLLPDPAGGSVDAEAPTISSFMVNGVTEGDVLVAVADGDATEVTLMVEAEDNVGVEKVVVDIEQKVTIAGRRLAPLAFATIELTSRPYQVVWDTAAAEVPNGIYTFRVTAEDARGNSATVLPSIRLAVLK